MRDPARWWQSTHDTIYQAEPGIGGKLKMAAKALVSQRHRQLIGIMSNLGIIWDQDFEGRFEDRAHAIALFERHIAEVKATIAPERLLVMRVADGWGPLCAFLGCPVPDVPFPRVNDRADFARRMGAGLDDFVAPKAEPLYAV